MSNSSPAELMNSDEVSSRPSDHGLLESLTGDLFPIPAGSLRTVAYEIPRANRKSSVSVYRASACSCPTAVGIVLGTSQSNRSRWRPASGSEGAVNWQGTRYARPFDVTPSNMASYRT